MGNKHTKSHTYKSGNHYDGQWKGNERHGYGTYKWTDGCIYEGDWVRNMQQGKGVQTFRNGNVYQGDFRNNNPHGKGVLTTKNGERIEGQWNFIGRSTNEQVRFNAPVGRYNLQVVVFNENNNLSQTYNGPATLHLTTGLLVLPGMSDPTEAIWEYAIAENGRDLLNQATTGNIPVATAVAISATASQAATDSKGDAQASAVPIVDATQSTSQISSNIPVVLASNSAAASANTNISASDATESVAFGFQDPALRNRERHKDDHFTMNPFNPRNYF